MTEQQPTRDGGRRDEAPSRLAELPLGLDLGHEAVRGRYSQVREGELPVLGDEGARELALENSGSLARLKLLGLHPQKA